MTSKSKTAKTLAAKNAGKPSKTKEAAKKAIVANTAAKKTIPAKVVKQVAVTANKIEKTVTKSTPVKNVKTDGVKIKAVPAKDQGVYDLKKSDAVIKKATKVITDQAKKTSKVLAKAAKTHESNGDKLKAAALKKAADGFAKVAVKKKPEVKPVLKKPVVKKVAALEKKPEVKKQPVSSTSNIIQAFANATTPQVDKNSGKLVLSPVSDKKIEPMTKVLAQVKKPETGKVTMQELFGKQPTAVPAAKTFPFLK